MNSNPVDEALREADRHIVSQEIPQAMEALRRARALCRTNRDVEEEAIVLGRLGELEMAEGNLSAARSSLTDALSLHNDMTTSSDRAYLWHLMGTLEDLENNPRKRDICWDKANQCYQEGGDEAGEARILRTQARAARRAHQEEKALDLYARALKIYTKRGQTFHQAMIMRELGLLQWDMKRPDLAHEAFERAIDLFSLNGDVLDEAQTSQDLGRMLITLGDVDNGCESLVSSRAKYHCAGDMKGEATALFQLGQVYQANDPDQAMKFFNEAAELAARVGLTEVGERAARAAQSLML